MQNSALSQYNDLYVRVLVLTLMAYAFLGKGFAYIGLPPFYMGEIILLLGLIAFLLSGCWLAIFTSFPSIVLSLLLVWVLARSIPYFSQYGFDSLRDSVVVTYSVFSFIVIALLIEKPARFTIILRGLSRALFWFCPIAVIAYCITRIHGMSVVTWPLSPPRLIEVRPGEIAVHLAGAASLALVGIMRVNKAWIVALLLGMGLIATQSRGGTLAFLAATSFAAVLMQKYRTIFWIISLIFMTLSITYVFDAKVNFKSDEGDRSLSSRQIVDNFTSIFKSSKQGNLDDNKYWRLNWWSDIREYTLHGPYFWTGKGFGVNLSVSDGYYADSSDGAPPLRSPHNAHMTILARAGVPGITLWLTLGLSWYALMVRNIYIGRIRCDQAWLRLFIFITAYTSALIINASFDVALEGPMLGIWFWFLLGMGIASSVIYQTQLWKPAEDAY